MPTIGVGIQTIQQRLEIGPKIGQKPTPHKHSLGHTHDREAVQRLICEAR